MTSDTKLIHSLIHKISTKLPSKSGTNLETLESDPLILQTVNSIVDLSKYKLSIIVQALTKLLETISQSTSMVLEDFVPCDVLQSQLFVLKILSAASNWNVVFARIRNKIEYLTTTNDEWPETAELKLLECVLRKAIWNWIEVFPSEFVTLCQSQRRLEGGPEILFDICFGLADNNRKKLVFWPLQTMLLILCPDILLSASISEKAPNLTNNKKVIFLDSLKSSLKRNKLADIAAVCYVDICKASTYVSKNETSALRMIVPEIENDLQERLFDPSRPFLNEQQIDHRLMTDCLTALFRLNTNILRSLIPVCLADTSPNTFKLVLVKSCYAIASEETKFPWNPQLSLIYPILASPLRKLFHQFISNRDKTTDIRRRRLPREKNDELERNEKMEIILNILKLYKIVPFLALTVRMGKEIHDVIYDMTLCVNDCNSAIRKTAAETLLELHKMDLIEQWGPPEMKMERFWLFSSKVMVAIARQILDFKEGEEGTKYLLDLLLQLFVRRNEFLKSNEDISNFGINIRERMGCNVVLELTLLVLLCSPDTDICTMAINCFRHLCIEAQLTTELIPEVMDVQAAPLSIVENIDVYAELSEPQVISGRMAQQKRIRKLLRRMKIPTQGNVTAWEEAYKRWRHLTALITKLPEDQLSLEFEGKPKRGLPWPVAAPVKVTGVNAVTISESQQTEWHNYTGFLSSLGGCCINEKQISILNNNQNNERIIESVYFNGEIGSNCHALVEKYVTDMVDLLVCDSIYVRESVRETLGTELSPRLYVLLFRNLESIVARFFDTDGEANPTERYTLFVEQAISVLKLILERIQELSENLYTVDLGGLVLSFARYLNRLGTGYSALIIKKKMCQLVEILTLKKEHVTLRQEIILRNRLLEIFIEWTSDFTMKTDAQGNSENLSNRSERLHRDLDQACLKTTVSLLAQLPLQPSDVVHEAELSGVKSRLFYKYFSFFIKLLNRCRILEAIDSGTHSAKNNQDLQMLLSKSREYVKDLGPLKDYTILALSNLLSANVESGLKYSLSMGYHEDSKTRTAFMQVLTNILNQGTEFEGLAENAMNDRYDKLVELVTESDLNVALSLCKVCPVSGIDEVARMLLAVFDSRNKAMPLLKAIIEKEVQSTESEATLFRRNCMATRMLAAFGKTHGAEYLRDTLQPLVQNLLQKSDDFSCELNPDNLEPGDDIERNFMNLKNTAQAFLDGICSSGRNMPILFRRVCHYIGSSVEEKYPRAKSTTVGAFIFLRFFNPAIVAPDNENLCKPIVNTKIKRALLLITKVIQNLANNVLFGAKEPYMNTLNEFLNSNIVKITTFLEEISKLPNLPQFADINSFEQPSIRRLDDSERKTLHKHLIENQEKMAKDLQFRRVKSLNPSISGNVASDQTHDKKAWDKISTLLAQLGPPTETQKKHFSMTSNYHSKTNHHMFIEFMRRNSTRNAEFITSKGVFYESGVSKEKRPVFYAILRRLEADSTDMELLMYHVLHTIEPYMGKPFELLVDLTQFSQTNEIQAQWVQQFLQILPFDAVDNLAALYFYNANTAFKKFVKKLGRPLPNKIAKKTYFFYNLNELYEFISSSELRLPKKTMALDTEQSVSYSQVTKISHYRMPIPTRKQDIFNGLNCHLNDVYHISEIEDVNLSSHRNDDNEFIIKQDHGRPSFSFTTKPTQITERVIRPNDVPGTLLNMALLNIMSEDPNLRLAAYNLLVALSLIFNFDVGNQLLWAK
ncbi:8733_t:CDS:10, partial [Diversispora eburnea]